MSPADFVQERLSDRYTERQSSESAGPALGIARVNWLSDAAKPNKDFPGDISIGENDCLL
jgi:hypothetical protein